MTSRTGLLGPETICHGFPLAEGRVRWDVGKKHLPELLPVSHSYIYGQTLVPEVEGGPRPTVHMLWTPIPPSLTLGGEERERCWQFLTAVAGSEEEAKRSWSAGLSLAASGSLHRSHVRSWAELRRGCSVELDGPLALRQALHGCLYYLLSAIPPRDSPGVLFHGISPGGLSNGTRGEDYWGHIFWDQVRGTVLILRAWHGGWGGRDSILPSG